MTPSSLPAPRRGRQPNLGPIPERLLSRLWRERAARQEWFRTNGGRRLRVVYPGRPAHGAGPDFRNALLELEGIGLVQGDVELHVHQRDWDGHGHARDPNYNGVVLHAALVAGPTNTVSLQSGQRIPVLSLAPLLQTAEDPMPPSKDGLWPVLARCGYPRPANIQRLAALLDRAGDGRFLARSAGFQAFLAEQTPEQTLYEGIMEALGYAANQAPFLQLAGRAPYQALARAALELPAGQRAHAIHDWLLRLSGLGSDGSPAAGRLPRTGFGEPMSRGQWRWFRLRPANQPQRRLAGAARLLARYLETGLVAGLRSAAASGPSRLTAALTVAAGPGEGVASIGLARARDVAVNAVLPLLHGLAVFRGEPELGREYLQLYHCFGRLQDNELLRELTDRLLMPDWRGEVNTARRQQGLLHLHRLLTGAS